MTWRRKFTRIDLGHTTTAAVNECGKVAHPGRKAARRVAKRFPTEHLRAYRCHDCGLWHLGHPPRAVLLGDQTAGEWYGRMRPESEGLTHG